jgi:hypothetical protein
MSILGTDYNYPSGYTGDLFIAHNLFDNIDFNEFATGSAQTIKVSDGPRWVKFEHNTFINVASHGIGISFGGSGTTTGFVFRKNLIRKQEYVVKGDATTAGTASLNVFAPGWIFEDNGVAGTSSGHPPDNQYLTTTDWQNQFVSYNGGSGGNYRLAGPPNAYSNAGNGDVGANISDLLAATACAYGGNCVAQPTAPEVVIYTGGLPASQVHGTWSHVNDATAAAGVKLATANRGAANLGAPLAVPANYFDAAFSAQANTDYTVWLRLKSVGNSNANDSVWVQFSDARVSGLPVYQIGSSNALLVNLGANANATNLNAWGWGNGAYWLAQAATVRFAASGTHTVRVQVREDGVEIDQIVVSPSTYRSSPPGPSGGDTTIVGDSPPLKDVVVYASEIPTLRGSWSRVTDTTAAVGSRLSTPDRGIANTTAAFASPVDYVDVPIQAPANVDYTIWLRLKAAGNSKWNDSVWVQFSDASRNGSPAYRIGTTAALLVNLATNSEATNLNGWGWSNSAYWLSPAATIRFSTTGVHTIRVQVREDGVSLDQIVLSPSRYLTSSPGSTGGDSTIVAKP